MLQLNNWLNIADHVPLDRGIWLAGALQSYLVGNASLCVIPKKVKDLEVLVLIYGWPIEGTQVRTKWPTRLTEHYLVREIYSKFASGYFWLLILFLRALFERRIN